MATIPIEVIVQDAETPVTPTPIPADPSDPGENTNITVPETGAGIVDSNIGNSMSSPATIIVSIVIAVLAIGAVIALLIRKYNKCNKANIEAGNNTRQETRAMAVTSIIAVLALTVLLGQLVVAGVVSPLATNAAADDTVNNEAELGVDSKITIIATRTEDEDTVIAAVKNTSTATSHQTFGYKVTASMAADATTANLYLDGDETSEYYIAPVKDDTLANNTWGYTLEEESEDYLSIPLAADPAVIVKGYDNIEDESVDIYYTIQVDKDLPAGTYTGTIEYTLTDNNFPSTLTTMQGMTAEICEDTFTPDAFKADNVTIEDNVPTATLTDIRDNKTYTIAKLADGKCWMTQNLDLQKEDLVVASLDSTNTDNPAEGFELPNSQTNGSESWVDYSDNEGSTNTARIYDIAGGGQEFYYCVKYSSGGEYCEEYGDQMIPSEVLGNYYNWYAATSGTGTYGLSSGEVASGSICPAGWRLPDGSINNGAADYSYLLYYYGIYSDPTSSSMVEGRALNMLKAPFSLMRAGDYFFGIAYIDARGFMWTSTAEYNEQAVRLYYSSEYTSPWGTDDKRYGFSIRCLAK